MKFQELVSKLPLKEHSRNLDCIITGIAYDSREVQPGFLFVAIEGLITDGHRFITEAVTRGAAGVLLQQAVPVPDGAVWVVVPDTRRALALVASRFYNEPTRGLNLVGVTGTNGKTTTAHLIGALFRARHPGVGLIGTIHNIIEDKILPVRHTTPESLDLQHLLRQMADSGVRDVVLEVSSHALSLDRVAGLRFDAAVFTNLTQDHLDFYAGMDDYFQAKARLFMELEAESLAIVNRDDAYGSRLLELSRGRKVTYGIQEPADVRATGIRTGFRGVEFTVESTWGSFPVALRLSGLFNVYNSLAAVAFGLAAGFTPDEVARVLGGVRSIPGRFERVDRGQEYTVVVDYAHTPDGLENVLRAAREVSRGRVIVVFGCGGDRDRQKRPLMGAISARRADYTVLTSDNPRSEEPLAILADIEHGYCTIRPDSYAVVPDRREAMRQALERACPGDVVVIAGKGHETYQVIGDRRLDFDDRLEAAAILESMGWGHR